MCGKKKIFLVLTLVAILALTVLLLGCAGKTFPEIPADGFLPEVLRRAGVEKPDRLMYFRSEEYTIQFSAYYDGITPDMIRDGGLAECSDIRADEVSLLVASDSRHIPAIEKALYAHRDREYSNYVKYSPEDAKRLREAKVYTYGNYVFLIVSDAQAEIRSAIEEILAHPETVADPGSETVSGSVSETASETVTGEPGQKFDFAKPVPASTPVGEEWLQKAVLIGDSRLYGLCYYLHPAVYRSFAFESMSINQAFSKELVETPDGRKCSVSDALAVYPAFERVYLMFGINELGWGNTNSFLDYYRRLIDRIREVNPEAEIYLMGLYPVEESAVKNYPEVFTNERIRSMNRRLLDLAAEKRVYYLDSYEALNDGDGLPAGSTHDGIHVGPGLCRQLLAYLLSHTVQN